MRTQLICAALAACLPASWPAMAQDASAISWCSTITVDADRLACFDRLAKEEVPQKPATGTSDNLPVPKPAIKPAGTEQSALYRSIDTDDLYASPSKYEGKNIQIDKVRCYHADKDEYRCSGQGVAALVIFSVSISPESERLSLENECGEIKKMASSPKCLKTIKFVPFGSTEDIISGYRKRLVVLTKQIEMAPYLPSKKR